MDQQQNPKLVGAWFRVDLSFEDNLPAGHFHKERGLVILEGDAESLARRVFRRVVSVLIRESGF